ncbi:MAG: nucleotidyltransferase family protein [Trueperaceae bacterium]
MHRQEVITTLKRHQRELERLGVSSVQLFGSVARNEATAESDVDLLVELSRPMGLEFFGLQEKFETFLHRPVDVGTPDSLREPIKESVLKEAVRVF